MSDLNNQIEKILKEISEIKENQKIANEKIEKIQNTIDDIEKDIFSDDTCGYEFEIVCPYCEYEFLIDTTDNKEVKCPECNNLIELDWSGNLDEEATGCEGKCCGCTECKEVSDEDDDM